jgi:hypothetical protein
LGAALGAGVAAPPLPPPETVLLFSNVCISRNECSTHNTTTQIQDKLKNSIDEANNQLNEIYNSESYILIAQQREDTYKIKTEEYDII